MFAEAGGVGIVGMVLIDAPGALGADADGVGVVTDGAPGDAGRPAPPIAVPVPTPAAAFGLTAVEPLLAPVVIDELGLSMPRVEPALSDPAHALMLMLMIMIIVASDTRETACDSVIASSMFDLPRLANASRA